VIATGVVVWILGAQAMNFKEVQPSFYIEIGGTYPDDSAGAVVEGDADENLKKNISVRC
jgi:hypothetical protein